MDENLIEHVAKALYHSMSDMKPREFPTGREWEGVRWDAVSAIKAMQSYKHSEACIHEPLISGPISNSCRKCGKIYPTAECPICRDANDYCVWHQPRHSLPDILKIQGDANILLDGINSIELFDDEIRYDGKTIYRGKYKRGEERDIIAKYTEAQRNKHSGGLQTTGPINPYCIHGKYTGNEQCEKCFDDLTPKHSEAAPAEPWMQIKLCDECGAPQPNHYKGCQTKTRETDG